jgi:aspartate/methionine/tyrosine aminotransferase
MRAHGSVYMHWAKLHAAARYNLANSGLLACGKEELELSPADLEINGPNHDGFRPLLAAIAERYGARPEQVVTAPGTSGANFLAFAALVEPGDEVLIEQPTYEPLLAALSWLGARLRRFQRRFEDGYRCDPDVVRAQLEAPGGRRVRLVVLTNPHNPSCALAPAAEVAEIGRLAERAGALVLVDEVYRDIWDDAGAAPGEAGPRGDALDQPGPPPPVSHLHLGPNILTTASLTKCYGLSGLRCGWALGPPEAMERLRRVNDFMAATHSLPSDTLALAAFRQLPRLTARARAILDPNRRQVSEFLAEHQPWLAAVLPARALMVFPRLLREDDSQALHDRLRRLETSIVPGRFFDHPRHFRLGFAVRPDDVAEGLRRLSQALRAS